MELRKNKLIFLFAITVLSTVCLFFMPRIPQDQCYHEFSDKRGIASIPNFFNVVSNFLFLLVGSLGFYLTLYFKERSERDFMLPANLMFFIGIFLTGIGSSYYHLFPSTHTLLWDRLPMTITFMAFFSIILSEYIDVPLGRKLLFHLIFLGIFSVLYWYKTEQQGNGDLRFYALIQFLPMLLIPFILLLFHSESPFYLFYWGILAVYVLAKILETQDHEVFSFTKCISGHSLKHIFASLVPVIYLLKLWSEKLLSKV